MRIRVLWSQTNGGAGLGLGVGQFSILDQRIGQIHMCLGEVWFQTQRDSNVRNAFRDMILRQEHPTQKIVSLCAAGCELDDLFEGGSGLREITTF